jgi:diguanylate cyclase (GGDEF)-like protein
VARWGGEEFVVILPHTPLEKAAEIANRMKELISMIDHDDKIGRVTASFGVTAFIDGDDTKSIIHRADQLLYAAKKHGKNKAVAG